MAIVKLGSINFSIPSVDRNYYLGSVLDTDNGFMVPKLITDASHFRLLYGDFPYADTYERLVSEYDLPTVVLPHITPKSKYNRPSVRLFEANSFGVIASHPRYGTQYDYQQAPFVQFDNEAFEKGELVLNQIFDFSNVSDNQQGYVMVRDHNQTVCFRFDNYPEFIPSEYYDALFDVGSYSAFVNKAKTQLSSVEVIDAEKEYQTAIYNSWIAPNGQAVQFSNDIEDEGYDLYQEFIANLWNKEVFLISMADLVSQVKAMIDESIAQGTPISDTDLMQRVQFTDPRKVIFSYAYPTPDLNFYVLDRLEINRCYNKDMDSICEYLEDKKLIDFYSKIKGSSGESILLTINESEYEDAYEIDIELGSLSESFICYLKKSPSLPDSAIDLRQLGQHSELLEVKVYDYQVDPTTRIDQYDFLDIFGSNDTFDPTKVIDITIPTGQFTLRRTDPEPVDEVSYQNALVEFSECNYYPDLFLVPSLHSNALLNDIYSYVRGQDEDEYSGVCEKGVFSQALITINKEQLDYKLINANNRMLYFYDDIIMDNVKYPTFYHYINHIISGTLLRIPSDALIANYDELLVGNAVDIQDFVRTHHEFVAGFDFNTTAGNLSMVIDDSAPIIPTSIDPITGMLEFLPCYVYFDPTRIEELFPSGELIGYYTLDLDNNYYSLITAVREREYVRLEGEEFFLPTSSIIGDIRLGNEVRYIGDNSRNGVIAEIRTDQEIMVDTFNGWISSTYLRPITNSLNEHGINYLHYENLYYFYPNLYEVNDMQKLFISRFVCSKVSRGFLEWGNDLKGSNSASYNSLISNVLARLKSCLPYTDSITYTSTIDGSKLEIHTTVDMTRLINKVFTIDYEVNLT